MHSLSSVVWCGVAWRTVALHGISVRVISIVVGGGVPAALVAWACISPPSGAFPGRLQAVLVVSGSFALLGVCLRMSSWLNCLAQRLVVALVCFLVFPLPPLPIQGSRGLSSIVFSIELTVQCDGCLIWGLGWWVGLVAGLRVGQAYLVFHRPGFGLLVSVPRSLSTQPPFATQVLIMITL